MGEMEEGGRTWGALQIFDLGASPHRGGKQGRYAPLSCVAEESVYGVGIICLVCGKVWSLQTNPWLVGWSKLRW